MKFFDTRLGKLISDFLVLPFDDPMFARAKRSMRLVDAVFGSNHADIPMTRSEAHKVVTTVEYALSLIDPDQVSALRSRFAIPLGEEDLPPLPKVLPYPIFHLSEKGLRRLKHPSKSKIIRPLLSSNSSFFRMNEVMKTSDNIALQELRRLLY